MIYLQPINFVKTQLHISSVWVDKYFIVFKCVSVKHVNFKCHSTILVSFDTLFAYFAIVSDW